MTPEELLKSIPAGVTVVAVSKMQPAEKIETLLQAGHRVFGENRVQEAKEKWPALRARYSDIRLHMVGHLQTNKAEDAVELFDAIHSLDSARLVKALADAMKKKNKSIPCFIQVNTGEEPQKGGVAPKEAEALLREARDFGLDVIGLMCVPPARDLPDPHFALLHKMAKDLRLKELSMGMSGDYEAALRFGATHLRLGTALFGER